MPIEVKKLGLQPKVEMTTEVKKTTTPDGDVVYSPVYKAEMVDSVEYVATGKEIHDPEFAKLMDDTADHDGAAKEKKASIFGTEWISTPDGGETQVRGDQVALLKSQGYGRKARNYRMQVPELPWHKDRKPIQGRLLVKYQDGKRLVYLNGVLQIEREAV